MGQAAIQSSAPVLPEATLRLAYSGGAPPAVRRRPLAIEHGILAMAVFLATETMLFAGLISAFLILRAGAMQWPPPGQPRLPIEITGLNTLVLLLSAYTMQRATSASRHPRSSEMVRWLGVTAALGTTFLLVQGVEWMRLIAHGLHASSGTYGASFYTLIGCHAVHVLAAVVALLALLVWSLRANVERCRTRVAVHRLYWFFVVAVWPILYVLVYLA